MPDSITILGAGGFIGRHLALSLAQRRAHVIAATTSPVDLIHESIEPAIAAFNEPDDFASLLARSRIVVHVASASTPGSTAGKPRAELSTNLLTSISLLEALQQAPHCRLLYVSSGGTLYGDRKGESARETDPLLPHSYHGAAKASIEHFINAWAEQCGTSALILRPSNVYGPGQPARRGFGVIPAALSAALDGSVLTIWGDGQTVRDYIFIDDFTRLCMMAIDRDWPRGTSVFNAASGEAVSLFSLLDRVQRTTHRIIHRVHQPPRAVDIHHIVPDASAVIDHFGWKPQVALDDGLARTWSWFRTHCRADQD